MNNKVQRTMWLMKLKRILTVMSNDCDRAGHVNGVLFAARARLTRMPVGPQAPRARASGDFFQECSAAAAIP